ncbi:serine endopeptidase [Oxalobacteraceae bacterium R-40]|uniref:Serine endopeptidase n=1 Tax=Keguizhuia sedimenti TaxID=3064264 RepID=A0ABU1BS52_9BURK|nr:serine endopeptidase [Oxalobacteraceae bacterium R-40]
MNKALRLSEKWFQRGLWLVALIFASFLIGLGSTIVSHLNKVEKTYSIDDFIDPAAAKQTKEILAQAQTREKEAQDALEQSRLKLQVAQADNRAARETFSNWLATRHVTARSDQDTELIERTQALDALKQKERAAQADVQAVEQTLLDARQAAARARAKKADLEKAAYETLQKARFWQEFRVFMYRLMLTLPLLGVAGWLFARKRKSTYWPFVWGFIFFAVFVFFFELVPYLPSYGGYVRYVVGIILTFLVGRQAILSLNRFLEKQRLAEQKSEGERRQELSYDLAMSRIAKGVCPGCERPVDLKDESINHCSHCGICLYDRCANCHTRKNAFSRFCKSCGKPATEQAAPTAI